MTRCVPTNSVFLPCEDERKKYEAILGRPPSYNPKVKIHDWQLHLLVEPRDNKTGNCRQSTYKHFGTDDDPTGISVTRAMTEEIHTAEDYAEEYRHRSLLNFYSLPFIETAEYEDALKFSGLELSEPDEPMDYRTTLRDDYPWHYHSKSLAIGKPEMPDEPWLMYRRTLGYSSHDLERRPGVSKFLDDNLDIQNRAAALKIQRFVSYNPFSKKYTDPTKLREIGVKNTTNQSG